MTTYPKVGIAIVAVIQNLAEAGKRGVTKMRHFPVTVKEKKKTALW